jgi:glycerophosphoryl diester phosphodiesterase
MAVYEAAEAQRLMTLGTDGIVTDRVDQFRPTEVF